MTMTFTKNIANVSQGPPNTFNICVRDIHITYKVLNTIQMKHIFLCVWAERVVLGSAKTALKFKYEI